MQQGSSYVYIIYNVCGPQNLQAAIMCHLGYTYLQCRKGCSWCVGNVSVIEEELKLFPKVHQVIVVCCISAK